MQTICMNRQYFGNYLSVVLDGKKLSKFDEDFIKNYEDSNKGCAEYPKDLHNLQSDLLFLQKEWKSKNAISMYAVCMIKKEYLVHMKAVKQTLNHELILKKYMQ